MAKRWRGCGLLLATLDGRRLSGRVGFRGGGVWEGIALMSGRHWLALLLVAICGGPSGFVGAQEPAVRARPGWYMGRQIAPTMSASGADWLIRETREREEQPRKLLAALQLRPGMQVCDFGCGNGYYTLKLADEVGPRGKVYAVDIQQEMLDLLEARAKPRGYENIEPVLATVGDSKLPRGTLDLMLMVDVYHELTDPPARANPEAAVREIAEPDAVGSRSWSNSAWRILTVPIQAAAQDEPTTGFEGI